MSDVFPKRTETESNIHRNSYSNNENFNNANQENKNNSSELTQTEIEIMSEVGNISISHAATTLFSLVNHQVKITNPRVSQGTLKSILEGNLSPKVVTSIELKNGLKGKNILIMDLPDAVSIANLIRVDDEVNDSRDDFGELELGAVGEVMNQMIDSAATAMGTMFGRKVDVLPPKVEVLNQDDEFTHFNSEKESSSVAIAFDMNVDGLISSRIVQLFTKDTVQEICEIMLNGTNITLMERISQNVEKTDNNSPSPEEDFLINEGKEFHNEFKNFDINFPEAFKEESKKLSNNHEFILETPLEFKTVLNKIYANNQDIPSLKSGSVIELDISNKDPLEISMNGKMVAEGEVAYIDEKISVRITKTFD